MKKRAHFRNIGIIAHIDAGKTTLTERLLFYARKIHRLGEVHDGNATMDFLEEEQKRGITISSACTTIEWKGSRINIIDTPGHVDFNVEVERALRVCDGAVMVFCAVHGIEPQSETVWRQARKYHLPKVVFVNKIDRPGADYRAVVKDIAARFGVTPLPLTVPAPGLEGAVLDVLHGRLLIFDPSDQGETVRTEPVPDREYLDVQRTACIEALADLDDDIMEKYLGGEEIGPDDLIPAVRRAVLSGRGVPVYCGSALKNIGVQPLMDGIGLFLPAPDESFFHTAVQEHMREAGVREDQFVGFVFKVLFDGAHKKNFLRVYNGRAKENSAVYNSRLGGFEKIHKLYTVHAGRHEAVAEAGPGEIILATGLKDCRTGDTLFTGKSDLLLENIDVLQPVLSVALIPGSVADMEKLEAFLERYIVEDPTLRSFIDEDTDQLIVSGLGELHLEVVLQRLQRESGVSFRYGNPQVIFMATIQSEASSESTCSRVIGDQQHRGRVKVSVRPAARGKGNAVSTDLPSSAQTAAAMRAVEDALQAGTDGLVMVDTQARIETVEAFEGGLTELGVRMATLEAMQQALAQASPIRLEPIMDIELRMPAEYVGDCVNLLGVKNARILDVRSSEHESGISALAPMRLLFGFATELRSRTKGKAFYSLKFSRYDTES